MQLPRFLSVPRSFAELCSGGLDEWDLLDSGEYWELLGSWASAGARSIWYSSIWMYMNDHECVWYIHCCYNPFIIGIIVMIFMIIIDIRGSILSIMMYNDYFIITMLLYIYIYIDNVSMCVLCNSAMDLWSGKGNRSDIPGCPGCFFFCTWGMHGHPILRSFWCSRF